MGNQPSVQKVNFEDIQNILHSKNTNTILINTLENNSQEQACVIPTTLKCGEEESVINKYLNQTKNIMIVIYGRNSHDMKIFEKYNQLVELGFNSVYIYPGGMFEWMLLQEIYTSEHFPTTGQELDILKFKPKSRSGMNTRSSY